MRKGALLLSLALPACALDLSQTLKAVEDRYNRANTLQVAFSEEFSGQGKGRRVESGTLSLRKPGRMRWDYTSPAGKLFLVDGKHVYLYSPGTHRVQRTKVKESGDMHAPLAFLLGKLDFQRDFRKFTHRPEGADTWIVAEPKSENTPYSQVEFAVTPRYQIRRVRVTGYDRAVLDFSFEQERVNPRLDDRIFQFEMPAGAQLEEAIE